MKSFLASNGTIRADVGTRGIFALATQDRCTDVFPFNDVNARGEVVFGQVVKFAVFTVSHDAGDFTGAAADTFFRICNDEPVHQLTPDFSLYLVRQKEPAYAQIAYRY